MLITEATTRPEADLLADACEYVLYHGCIPYTTWGVVRFLTYLEWEYVRKHLGDN